jgi:putative ABC transport system permease protein
MRLVVDIVGDIFRTLWAHKLRSFLTMFGIAWGVGSLLLLVGLGEGFRSGNQKNFDEIGRDIMFVFPWRTPTVRGSQASGRWYKLTYDDYMELLQAPHIRAASPMLSRDDIRSVSDYSSGNGQVIGIEPQFHDIRFTPIQYGCWINMVDEAQKRQVAIIGPEIVHTLFPGRPVLGSTLLLNGYRFEIVGQLATVGRGDNVGDNSKIYIPYTTMAMYFPLKWNDNKDALTAIAYQPRVREEHETAHHEMRAIIARNHGFDANDADSFEEWDSIRTSESVAKIFNAMDMFLGFVGMVTLALGAIGVINIMLVSVTERTREIGLRKALGATNHGILFQFFIEGAMLTIASGGIGILFAQLATSLLAHMPSPRGFDPPRIVASSAVIAIVSLAAAGIAAGLYPASKAAHLEPVEALRQE